MKASVIIDNLIDDPRSGRPTDDKQNVFSCRSPIVPEVFESGEEVRFMRIHPREFVEEDDFLRF